MRTKIYSIVLLLFGLTVHLQASSMLSGQVIDAETKEPLIGVAIVIKETTHGSATDLDGNFEIKNLNSGNYTVEASYIGYKTMPRRIIISNGKVTVENFELQTSDFKLDEVQIVARRNDESSKTLMLERRSALVATEKMGASEMSAKGISNVAEGIKKISGVSLGESNQLFVRGLGDRYSATSLNGLPIASPNPDQKLIPLDLFPTATLKNIAVDKVYNASVYADYSGAHIDINTKTNIGNNFTSISIGTGANTVSTFNTFYQSDRGNFRWTTNRLPESYKTMTSSQFAQYSKEHVAFKNTFDVKQATALPNLSGQISFGREWQLKQGSVDLIASLGSDYNTSAILGGYNATINVQGETLNAFYNNKYQSELNLSGLVSLGYSINNNHRLTYTLLSVRNATDEYNKREGFDSEGVNLIGSNSVFRVYYLLNNQLYGEHKLNEKWRIDWGASYGVTGSEEPDRRQVMYRVDNENISLFKLNQQETMRYFGELNENQLAVNLATCYTFNDRYDMRFGASLKDKRRDFTSTRFYYNLSKINPTIEDIYHTNGFLNQNNIENGLIKIVQDRQPKSSYYAGQQLFAGFVESNLKPVNNLAINVGVRFEQVNQWVDYWNDASMKKQAKINEWDIFPALNLKYNMNNHSIRGSFSRTVTRPSFIEMAPFLYKESYGSAEIRGNDQLTNGYNYNADFRYELIADNNVDMISTTLYVKYLEKPIERIQESSGGSAVHSFRNANNGYAAGLEIEARKLFFNKLNIGINASLIYTNVLLSKDGGIYTDTSRPLQGASPYLVNADIAYEVLKRDDMRVNLTLLYNLQGPRIQAVGIFGMNNTIEKEYHQLDFVGRFDVNRHWSISLKAKNLLNSEHKFTQQNSNTHEKQIVESFRNGQNFEISGSFNF